MRNRAQLLRQFQREDGQILPWMALLVVLFLGMAGLTIDLGHAYVAYRELQGSTDAAALAGAYAMGLNGATQASVDTVTCTYSSNTDTDTKKGSQCGVLGNNRTPNLPGDSVTTTFHCEANGFVTVTCPSAPLGGMNVIQVVQTATVPTYFIQALSAFGLKTATSITLSAKSSATISGSTPPVAVAMLIDTTASMGTGFGKGNTQTCGAAPIDCAMQGAQTLLGQVPTCAQTDPITNICTKHNYVGLFTFPAVDATTTGADTCSTAKGTPKAPTIVPYTYSPEPLSTDGPTQWNTWTAPISGATYQIAGFSDVFNTGVTTSSGTGYGLNSSSPVVGATGGGSCAGMQAKGGEETYYAGAIEMAEAALQAQVNGDSSYQKVMIILSDGAANSSSITNPAKPGDPNIFDYGSTVNECQQAIAAAQNVTKMGTRVYTIAYGSAATGCTTDKSGSQPNIAPCQTMQQMASTPGDFYAEAGSAALCGKTAATLPQIFSGIVSSFSKGRLIPNS
ncbi:MAG TPA: VWA domain-containing protein [Terracidiphilus sp.]|nr:VWA domain-containing protein [Terracidiphilus sp.]